MRILAIDSATEACSAALFDGGTCIGSFHQIIGRGHAESLVPAIADMPGKGCADRILVSLGPGSFTGVRIGLAAARALGLAWNVEVLGYPTLALVATVARAQKSGPVSVCMTGGHGEYFVQDFAVNGLPIDDVRSLAPSQAAIACQNSVIAGSKAEELAALIDGDHLPLNILPDARHALALPEQIFTPNLSPIYGRAPDARLPGGLKIPGV